MYFKASAHPKYNSTVSSLQSKLNAIKIKVHGNWPHLTVDGLFGEQTKKAVKGFQSYRNLTPVSGEIGDTTIWYINEVYNHVSQLSVQTSSQSLCQLLNKLNGFIKNEAFGLLKNISEEANNQINNIKLFENTSALNARLQQLVNKKIIGNPTLKSLQNTVKDLWRQQDIAKSLEIQAKRNTNAYNYVSSKHQLQKLNGISNAQRQFIQSKSIINNLENSSKQLFSRCLKELQMANFANKIDRLIKNSPKVTKAGSIKGGGFLTAISLIPFASDVAIYMYCVMCGLPSEDEKNKVIKDFISMIEGAIIGVVVSAVVAAVGLTGSVAVIVVVIICLLIGLIIAIFCPEDTVLEWIAKEINKTIHSSVFQQATRTSFV